MYKYFPHTEDDLQAMLAKVGVKSLDELYAQIPENIRFGLPSEMSEIEVRQLFERLGSQNRQMTCFAGYGVYDHYTPSVIPQLLQRSEFLTSYTPYQAEISQGTLHYIFEYQSMMAELTGMDISNASMYDGTTATAEAMMMAVAAGKKQNKVLVSETLNGDIRPASGYRVRVNSREGWCDRRRRSEGETCKGRRGWRDCSATECLWYH